MHPYRVCDTRIGIPAPVWGSEQYFEARFERYARVLTLLSFFSLITLSILMYTTNPPRVISPRD